GVSSSAASRRASQASSPKGAWDRQRLSRRAATVGSNGGAALDPRRPRTASTRSARVAARYQNASTCLMSHSALCQQLIRPAAILESRAERGEHDLVDLILIRKILQAVPTLLRGPEDVRDDPRIGVAAEHAHGVGETLGANAADSQAGARSRRDR